jgi:hypothetical protein
MKSRPKYLAVVNFSCNGHRFTVGDPVDHPIVLDAVLRHGEQFVSTTSRRVKSAALTEADPPAEASPTASNEPTEATS